MFFIGLQNLNKHLIHSRQHLLTHLCWHFLILSNLLSLLLYSMMTKDRYFNHQLYWTDARLKEMVFDCQRYWFSGEKLLEEEATWEGEHEIQQLYPHFDLEDKVNFNGGGIDTNNNIMRPKNKNSQTMEKVKKSTRMGQHPKWLENYTCWRAREETVCGMWVLLFSIIEFFILSSVIPISSSIIAYCDSHFQVISNIQKKDQILIAIIFFVIP